MKTEEVEPKLTVGSGECREACSPGEWKVLKDGRTDECSAANASKGGRRRMCGGAGLHVAGIWDH
jgi:hypothetical protein